MGFVAIPRKSTISLNLGGTRAVSKAVLTVESEFEIEKFLAPLFQLIEAFFQPMIDFSTAEAMCPWSGSELQE